MTRSVNASDPRVPGVSVLLSNLNSPELNYLAIEFSRQGVLSHYVRPYANRKRAWERALAGVPGVGDLYARTLGRRVPPAGLPLRDVIGAGQFHDFAAAGIGRLPLPRGWRRRVVGRLHFGAERAIGRRAARLASEADIVVSAYGTGLQAFEAARLKGARTVLNYPIAHNRFQLRLYAEDAARSPQYAAALPRLSRLPREYQERLERECEIADRILVGSEFVRRSFLELGYARAQLTLIPYGVDLQRFVPPTDRKKDGVFRVLFVGQIGQRKGVGYLLEACRRIQRPDIELVLVGGYVPGAEVYAKYAGGFRHVPHVPQAQLPALYQQADVFVLPSLVEGMPLVVLEAMACGVPVVVTSCGTAEVVRDGVDGFLVPVGDAIAIAERLEQLHGNPDLRAKMSLAARMRAEQFSWARYAEAAAAAVLELAERRN